MRISFNLSDGTSRTSPEFEPPPAYVIEEFWAEYLGSDDEDNELFWCADVSGSDEWVHVDWSEDPVNPDRVILSMSEALHTRIPDYKHWRQDSMRSWDLPEHKESV